MDFCYGSTKTILQLQFCDPIIIEISKGNQTGWRNCRIEWLSLIGLDGDADAALEAFDPGKSRHVLQAPVKAVV
jgi:hypothetical protein